MEIPALPVILQQWRRDVHQYQHWGVPSPVASTAQAVIGSPKNGRYGGSGEVSATDCGPPPGSDAYGVVRLFDDERIRQ